MNSTELEEARQLFERAEREADPVHKLEALQEALDITDDLRQDSAISENESTKIINIRHTYLHRLIVQLTSLRHIDIYVWLNYIKLLLVRVAPEADEIVAADERLKKQYLEFIGLWANELEVIVKRSAKRP